MGGSRRRRGSVPKPPGILGAFTAAQVANCALWSAYGLFAAKDVYVYGPNLTGLALGLTQLFLKVVFPSSE